jgi:hypothetical protein
MGANHQKKLSFMRISKARLWLYNFRKAHLEGFGVEGVIAGKVKCINIFLSTRNLLS